MEKGLTPMELAGEKMDPKIKSEISDLMLIMENWRKSYASWCTEGEDNEWVYREFCADIQDFLQPYAHALVDQDVMSYLAGQAVMGFAYSKMEELRDEYK